MLTGDLQAVKNWSYMGVYHHAVLGGPTFGVFVLLEEADEKMAFSWLSRMIMSATLSICPFRVSEPACLDAKQDGKRRESYIDSTIRTGIDPGSGCRFDT
jgi:hypothetical protein